MGKDSLMRTSIIFIAFVVLVMVFRELATILRPLALAAFITILTIPIYNFAKRKKIPAVIPIIGIFIILIVAVYLLVGLLTVEVSNFSSKSDEYIAQIEETMSFLPEDNRRNFSEISVRQIVQNEPVNSVLSNSASLIGNGFSEIFLALLFSAFMIPAYRKALSSMSGKHRKLKLTLTKIQKSSVSYLRTKTFTSFGTAACSAIVLALFGADFVWTIALIMFLLNFIPSVGTYIAISLAMLLFFLKFGVGVAFFVLLGLLLLIEFCWGSFIEPKLSGSQLQLSALLIIINLFFWAWLWGIGGMLIATPLLVTIKIVLEHFDSPIAKYMQ